MKNKLSSFLVAGTMASVLPLSIAQADETKVYGKLHLNYGTYEEKSGSTTVEDNWQFPRSSSHDVAVMDIIPQNSEIHPPGVFLQSFRH